MKEFHETIDLEKRASAISKGIKYFLKEYKDVTLIEDAAIIITAIYKNILVDHVKPLLPKRVNKFKMGAILALTVVRLQPIQKNTGGEEYDIKNKRILNADLAFFLAMNLIIDMIKPNAELKISGLKFVDDSISSVKTQHLNWLQIKKQDSFPIFPMASFYYCLFVIIQTKFLGTGN